MTIRQLRDVLANLPDADWGFVQQTEVFSDKGTESNFRCFLKIKEGPFAEQTMSTPKESVKAVFDALKIPLPEGLR